MHPFERHSTRLKPAATLQSHKFCATTAASVTTATATELALLAFGGRSLSVHPVQLSTTAAVHVFVAVHSAATLLDSSANNAMHAASSAGLVAPMSLQVPAAMQADSVVNELSEHMASAGALYVAAESLHEPGTAATFKAGTGAV